MSDMNMCYCKWIATLHHIQLWCSSRKQSRKWSLQKFCRYCGITMIIVIMMSLCGPNLR